jgi:tetratricopeptide (TPR) repeat protein
MQLRPRPPQVVVIPLEQTRGLPIDDLGQAKDRLGASHVLKATVTRQGDQLLLRGAIIDTTTKLPLAERTGTYAAADPGAVASALSALVASAFRLPRQRTAEQVAPVAYRAYADGVAALSSGDAAYARAVEDFEQAIALDPNSVLPRARLAEACYRGWKATGDQQWLARGRDELAGAERLNSDSIAVRLAAGLLSSVPGSYDRAVEEYRRATELDPMNQDAWNGFAQALNLAGHDAEAVAAFDKAITLQPGYYLPINQLGALYYRLGNSGEAEKQWLRVTALAPERFEGHVNLGVLYADLGRFEAAEGELRRALQIEPTSRAVLNNLGALFQYMGRDREAVQYLEQALAVGPQTYTVFLNLGDSYRRLGRQTDAANAYRRGRALAEPILLADPRDSATRAFIAYFALRLGDHATAERELGQALTLGKDSGTVLRRAALCFEAIGDRERSLTVLQSAPPVVLKELSRHPDLLELRGDPRFVALLQHSTRG